MADTAAPNVNQALKKLKISGVGRCFREGGHQSHVSLWLKSVHEITQYYGGLQPLEPPPPSYDTENNRLQVYLCMATHSKQPV